MSKCKFMIGNSSSGIREAEIYKIPVINIGTRQNGRERNINVIDVVSMVEAILNYAIEGMLLCGDLNSDDSINISDVVVLVNIILGGGSSTDANSKKTK